MGLDSSTDLTLPSPLSTRHQRLLSELAVRNDAAHDADLLGLVLTGSVGRDHATAYSDLDVFVVLTDEAAGRRRTEHSAELDEIPIAIGCASTRGPTGPPMSCCEGRRAVGPPVSSAACAAAHRQPSCAQSNNRG